MKKLIAPLFVVALLAMIVPGLALANSSAHNYPPNSSSKDGQSFHNGPGDQHFEKDYPKDHPGIGPNGPRPDKSHAGPGHRGQHRDHRLGKPPRHNGPPRHHGGPPPRHHDSPEVIEKVEREVIYVPTPAPEPVYPSDPPAGVSVSVNDGAGTSVNVGVNENGYGFGVNVDNSQSY